MRPFVNAAGTDVVFEKDFQLFVYNIATKKTRKIPLQGYISSNLEAYKPFSVSKNISAFDVSPDGKKLAFVSRGRLFVSDVKGKFVREMNTTVNERVGEVYWLKDNETLLFAQTNQGFQNLYTLHAADGSAQKQVTNEPRTDRAISFNSDRSKAVYLSGNDEVRLLDLNNMKSSVLAQDEIWGLNSSVPYFSPDDRYVMYNAIRNFESDIMLIRLSDKQVVNITNTGVTEQDPVWSPDGKYIYFVSNRTEPAYPYGLRDARIYRMALERFVEPLRSDMYDSLFVETKDTPKEKKDTDTKDKKDSTTKDKKESVRDSAKTKRVNIDFRNMMDRLERIGPGFGSQNSVQVIQDGEKTRVLFLSNHENGRMGLYQRIEEPFENTKTEKIKGVDGFIAGFSLHKNTPYVLMQGDILKVNLAGNSSEKIDIDHSFSRNLASEFEQMFYEAWAVLNENYYQQNFNDVNWVEIKNRYASYLPYVETRNDIRTLLNDMMGELNTSHYGFSTMGAEENTFYNTITASTGLLFSDESPYTVKFVIPNDVADFPDGRIRPGDVLKAVDGKPVDVAQNREFYFMGTRIPPEMSLTFVRGAKEYTVKIQPVSYGVSSARLYDVWENQNKQLVNRLGNQRIGYVHMRDMGGSSLEKFELDMVSDSVAAKDALILDLRYNTGGNVHDKVLQFLSREPYLKWKYRNGKLSPQPNFAPAAKPIVLLMNEQTLSDGEMTAAGFKELGLGTIIGTETYRWIIFTTAARLVDGSAVRLPSWGCYTLDGKDLEKTGVAPDIQVVNTFKDRMEGDDPQIERAVREILQKFK